jgi:drug/metabolite transporter (DMT)-like permease
MPQPSKWRVVAVLAIGVLSVSTAAIFIRLALAAAGTTGVGFSLVLAAARLSIAALVLAPAWRGFRQDQRLEQLSEPKSRVLSYSIAAGICLAFHFATWISSLSYTSIAASTALVTTNPIWVALLSWLWFREQPTRLTIAGIGMTLLGSLLIGMGETSGNPIGSNPWLGNSLALVGSWAVSLYFLLGREAQRHGLSVSSHVVLTYTTAAIVLLPLPLLFGAAYTGYPAQVYVYILLMAIFPQLIGHTSFNWAVRYVSPTLVTLTILAEPIGSGILGAIVFHENPGSVVILGAGVILTGVAIAAVGASTMKAPTT